MFSHTRMARVFSFMHTYSYGTCFHILYGMCFYAHILIWHMFSHTRMACVFMLTYSFGMSFYAHMLVWHVFSHTRMACVFIHTYLYGMCFYAHILVWHVFLCNMLVWHVFSRTRMACVFMHTYFTHQPIPAFAIVTSARNPDLTTNSKTAPVLIKCTMTMTYLLMKSWHCIQ